LDIISQNAPVLSVAPTANELFLGWKRRSNNIAWNNVLPGNVTLRKPRIMAWMFFAPFAVICVWAQVDVTMFAE
jgi:hypothetical protein